MRAVRQVLTRHGWLGPGAAAEVVLYGEELRDSDEPLHDDEPYIEVLGVLPQTLVDAFVSAADFAPPSGCSRRVLDDYEFATAELRRRAAKQARAPGGGE